MNCASLRHGISTESEGRLCTSGEDGGSAFAISSMTPGSMSRQRGSAESQTVFEAPGPEFQGYRVENVVEGYCAAPATAAVRVVAANQSLPLDQSRVDNQHLALQEPGNRRLEFLSEPLTLRIQEILLVLAPGDGRRQKRLHRLAEYPFSPPGAEFYVR